MAAEKRMIDAKAYHARLSNIKMTALFPDWKELPRDTKDRLCELAKEHERLLFEQTIVDAVEVVRCRDCRHYKILTDYRSSTLPVCGRKNLNVEMHEEDFCSRGERNCL